MEKKRFSIKYRVLTYVFALLLPLTLITGGIAVVQMNETRRQLENSKQMNLELIISLLEQETSEIEMFLYNLALNNRSFRAMADEQTATQLYSHAYEAYGSVDSLLKTYEDLTYIAMYSVPNDYYIARNNGLEYLAPKTQIQLNQAVERRFLRYFYEDNLPVRGWFTVEIWGRNFLCRAVNNQGICCVCAIDLEHLVGKLEADYELDDALVFHKEETLLTHSIFRIKDWSEQMFSIDGAAVNQELRVASSDFCGIQLSYIWPYKGLTGGMGGSSIVLIIITVGVLVCLPFIYLNMKANFFVPLDSLVQTMDRISEGNLEAQADDTYASKEFRQVNRTFNQMITQIRLLRIEQYEREIESRQAQLQFLQVQIRPHFYLNCLKTLYSLAEQHKFKDVSKGILLISNHLRYAFQQQAETVPLSEEIRLCDNYVKLCGVLTETMPELLLDIDHSVLDVPIPPISLLTFVENSIRFGLEPQRRLQVSIMAHKLHTEDGDILGLTVRDNGIGFTQEQLVSFNGTEWYHQVSTHVGIQNVIRRFRLIYGENFSFAFSNRNGAMQELYIPIRNSDQGEPFKQAQD